MTLYILVKTIHFVSIFSMIACLSAELVLLKPRLNISEMRKLAKIDGIYGMSALLAVAAGLTLWFAVGKPAAFYYNHVFYVKIVLVIIAALLSIGPTVFFIKNAKKQEECVDVPGRMKKFVILQLVILALVPVLAITMANGIRF